MSSGKVLGGVPLLLQEAKERAENVYEHANNHKNVPVAENLSRWIGLHLCFPVETYYLLETTPSKVVLQLCSICRDPFKRQKEVLESQLQEALVEDNMILNL